MTDLRPAEKALILELRKRKFGTVIVVMQDGVPMTITPILTEAKLKLA